MKYQGRIVKGPKTQIVAIPRDEGDIVFIARAVTELADFDEILPRPQPPEVLQAGGQKFKNVDDPEFQKELQAWGEKKVNWMILKSLEASEELEWDTVKMDDPETWGNFRTELRESGFNNAEITHIVNAALVVNSIDEAKMEEARKRFLASKPQTQAKQ